MPNPEEYIYVCERLKKDPRGLNIFLDTLDLLVNYHGAIESIESIFDEVEVHGILQRYGILNDFEEYKQ